LVAIAIELLAELPDQFTFGPGQAGIVDRHRKDALLAPAIALDVFRAAALAAISSW
jgi:hypothetical protein